MGIFDKLFGKRRVDNNPQKTEPSKPRNDYMTSWEKERHERIVAAELRLKDWITNTAKEKNGLSFTWESGNDEAFVSFKDSSDLDEGNLEDLEEYIIDKLDIPDAGEFQMNGSGDIYLAQNLVKVKYSSIMKGIIDFNEETEEEIYSEEETDSGDKVLFEI